MKTWKKWTSVVLAVVMILSFAACSGNGKMSPTEEAEKTVDGYLSAVCDLNLKKAASYLDNPGEVPFEDFDSAMEEILDAAIAETPEMAPYREDFRKVFQTMAQGLKDGMSYRIVESKEDGDHVIVTVEFTMPDFESMNVLLDNYLAQEEVQSRMMEIVFGALAYADGTEQEQMDAIMPGMMALLDEAMTDCFQKMDSTTTEVDILVKKNADGKWLIDTENSDLDEFDLNNLDMEDVLEL